MRFFAFLLRGMYCVCLFGRRATSLIRAFTNLFSALLLTLWLGACQTMELDSGYDSSVDFAAHKTFTWSGPHPLLATTVVAVNPTLESHLMQATRFELERRGMSFVDAPEQADVVVSFAVGREQIRVGSHAETFQYAFATGVFDTVAHEFSESRLGINMFDAATRQLVWHGSARRGITGADQANVAPTVAKMVAAILRTYPPKK